MNEFKTLGNTEQLYFCQKCTNSIFSFQNLNKEELSDELYLNNRSNENCCIKLPDVISLDHENYYRNTQDFHLQYSNKNHFSIIHINIRSLIKNFEKLEELLANLGKTPELIAISETKL